MILMITSLYRRHFISQSTLKTHFKSKPHKRRYLIMKAYMYMYMHITTLKVISGKSTFQSLIFLIGGMNF